MGGGLESRCGGRVFGADGAARYHPHRNNDSLHSLPFLNYLSKCVLMFSLRKESYGTSFNTTTGISAPLNILAKEPQMQVQHIMHFFLY